MIGERIQLRDFQTKVIDRVDESRRALSIAREDLRNGWRIRGEGFSNRNAIARVGLTLEGGLLPFVIPLYQIANFMVHSYDSSYFIANPSPETPIGLIALQGVVGATAGYLMSEGWNAIQGYMRGREERRTEAKLSSQMRTLKVPSVRRTNVKP